MRIVFMGSGALAGPCLHALAAWPDAEISAVFAQPDRPKGRGGRTAPCPAAEVARSIGWPTFTPERVNAEDAVHAIAGMRPEALVVVAYGQILRARLLALPRLGCINVHASLLPRWRGAAPIQWAIAHGDAVTGITTMFMNERMDEGDIILQQPVPIEDSDTAANLEARLALAGADLLVETLRRLAAGVAPRRPQIPSEATYARKISKQDGRLDWTLPAARIRDRVRAFNPWPVCFAEVPAGSGRILRILEVSVISGAGGEPGTCVAHAPEGPVLAAGQDAVCLTVVQPEGRKPMNGAAFLCGHPLAVGARAG